MGVGEWVYVYRVFDEKSYGEDGDDACTTLQLHLNYVLKMVKMWILCYGYVYFTTIKNIYKIFMLKITIHIKMIYYQIIILPYLQNYYEFITL
jgi:hypothetical protein